CSHCSANSRWISGDLLCAMGLPKTAYLSTASSSATGQPVAIGQEILGKACFRAAGLRLPVVAPADLRRQRHETGLGAPAGLQPEQGAAVEHQVELHVAAAPVGLELALALAEGRRLAALHDRQVGLQIGIAHRAQEGEAGVEVPLVEVVEEQPADATRLVAMLEVEVAVAPFLEARVDVGAERRAGLAGDLVPVHAVFLVGVV